MNALLNRPVGRLILHLLAYGLAAFGIAVIEELQVYDFGQYQALASVALGLMLDALRKYRTSI